MYSTWPVSAVLASSAYSHTAAEVQTGLVAGLVSSAANSEIGRSSTASFAPRVVDSIASCTLPFRHPATNDIRMTLTCRDPAAPLRPASRISTSRSKFSPFGPARGQHRFTCSPAWISKGVNERGKGYRPRGISVPCLLLRVVSPTPDARTFQKEGLGVR